MPGSVRPPQIPSGRLHQRGRAARKSARCLRFITSAPALRSFAAIFSAPPPLSPAIILRHFFARLLITAQVSFSPSSDIFQAGCPSRILRATPIRLTAPLSPPRAFASFSSPSLPSFCAAAARRARKRVAVAAAMQRRERASATPLQVCAAQAL